MYIDSGDELSLLHLLFNNDIELNMNNYFYLLYNCKMKNCCKKELVGIIEIFLDKLHKELENNQNQNTNKLINDSTSLLNDLMNKR